MATIAGVKVSTKIVEAVLKFAEVKAQITELEKTKDELSKLITEAFGDSDLIIHRNLEVARRDWRTRETLSAKELDSLIASELGDNPELAEIVQKLVSRATKTTTYPVIVTLYR